MNINKQPMQNQSKINGNCGQNVVGRNRRIFEPEAQPEQDLLRVLSQTRRLPR